MILIRKYKTFVAAILLALYAFIATPVQLWHHHDYAYKTVNTAKELSGSEQTSISNFSDQSVDPACKICSLHYSVYTGTSCVRYAIPIPTLKPANEFYIFTIPASPFFSLPNKGPPVLA